MYEALSLILMIEIIDNFRYLVTELMATDLNTILKAKKVEDQFAQYFMYQIMVRTFERDNEGAY